MEGEHGPDPNSLNVAKSPESNISVPQPKVDSFSFNSADNNHILKGMNKTQ